MYHEKKEGVHDKISTVFCGGPKKYRRRDVAQPHPPFSIMRMVEAQPANRTQFLPCFGICVYRALAGHRGVPNNHDICRRRRHRHRIQFAIPSLFGNRRGLSSIVPWFGMGTFGLSGCFGPPSSLNLWPLPTLKMVGPKSKMTDKVWFY
ncbi:hypothetical protein V6N13_132890 [Hibiscus sabdariffa]|uniref:Uncharacterized protein n=1 Tax=Hibiscus sabdariffa TaxID=183260 RepID=A0ABR2PWL8_9ROSI